MKFPLLTVTLALLLGQLTQGTAQVPSATSPFSVTGTLSGSKDVTRVRFSFDMPADHVLYADRLVFEAQDGNVVVPVSIPEPVVHRDALTGAERKGYDRPFSAELDIPYALPVSLLVKFQGCSNSACYFPERHAFVISSGGVTASSEPSGAIASAGNSPGATLPTLEGFKVGARETGYIPKKKFVEFLTQAKAGGTPPRDAAARFQELGPWVSLLLILIGGVGLNMTPCVLPLIPINLAIIGAGARASSRRKGFALGGAYGAGMALVYGVLGLVVVLTGAKFGTLNSSAWFNLGIAVVFGLLALAMFDYINVDFSRFQSRTGGQGQSQKGQFVLALTMGVMAALLAGACVAPVVISVLLLAAHFYAKGLVAGLLLPFLLGLGMALPWPFAGAGLSFLPKPGKWMKWVKYSFGVLILLFAGYYGSLAVHLLRSSPATAVLARTDEGRHAGATQEQILAESLQAARAQHRPVLIDFAASWCKNCQAMDAAVFPAPEVRQKLQDFIVVRYDAEKPNDPPARDVLTRFGVMGLPTYVVLIPGK